MTKVPEDWSEFLRLLNAHKTKYLVVGAHALAAHGRPRATQDLDVLVEPSVTNAKRVADALAEFGFESLAGVASKLASGNRMATLGREPFRIDLLNWISGVSFARAWRGKKRARLGGVPVYVLGLAELVANKRASGRTKDRLDVELLREAGLLQRRRAK